MSISRAGIKAEYEPLKPRLAWPPARALRISLARLLAGMQPRAQGALRIGLTIALLLGVAISPAAAGSRQAKKYYEQGRKAELRQEYDRALELYRLAQDEEPEHQRYELSVKRMSFVAAQAHVDVGQKVQAEGQLEQALEEFRLAMEIDPSSSIARQEYERTLSLMEDQKKKGKEDEPLPPTPLDRERKEREDRIGTLKDLPVLQPLSTQPINYNIPNQDARVVFETIGKLAGINVLFDSEYQDKKIPVELQNVTLTEALDYVSLLAKTYWKPVSHNAIFITNDTTNKRRDYEEEIVKTFYLTNVATPQEMQEIMTAIRGLTDVRRIFPVNSMNAMIIRGPASKVALAEKVINDVDKARPEILVDVLVIETSKSKTRELGISPMSGGAGGIDIPVVFAPGGTPPSSGDDTTSGSSSTSSGGSISLSKLGGISSRDFLTTLPDARLVALMSSSDSRLLQSPRIRAADGFQASLRIGDRIPIATGSFQPGIGGVGINPLVNTQFNFEDVGVNLDLTPKIHSDSEVSLHVEIEVSNVRDRVDIGGIEQPIIGQRTITHDIRLQEGEASVLGGLNQTQTFRTKSGVPFLGEIPFLGNFFSTTKTEVNENEILIVLIPHIVRVPEIRRVNLQGVASGTDQVFQVRYDHEENNKPALPPVGAHAPAEETPAPVAEARPGEPAQPATETPATPEPAADTPAAPEPAPPAAQPAQPAQAGPRFVLAPATPQVGVGESIEVNVVIQDVNQLFGLPMRIRYDRKIVRLVDIKKGPFLESDGQDLIFARNIRSEVGQAAVNISRFPGTGGIDGGGTLITMVFEGTSVGTSAVQVTPTSARDANAQVIQIPPVEFKVSVR